jgi:hypothetical protein
MTATTFRRVLWSLTLALSSTALSAVEYTWDKGAGTLDWNTPANWTSDTKPVAGDTATFAAAGLAAGDTVTLGADQAIGTLRINNAPSITVGGGGTYGLALGNGRIQGAEASGAPTHHTVDAPIVLGTNGSFQAYGSYGASLVVKGAISDGGSGYGLGFVPSQNHLFTLQGNNTYSGDTTFGGRGLTVSGADGAIRNSALVLNLSVAQFSTVTLENTAAANADRLGDAMPVRVELGGGKLRLVGHASTAIIENAGTLRLLSGLGQLDVSRQGAAGAAVELNFAGYERAAGTGLRVMCNTTSDAYDWNTFPRLVLTGVADGLLPYATQELYDPSHVVVESGLVKKFNAYTALPTAGGSATTLHSAAANLSLAGDADTLALLVRQTGANNITLDLGDHDLRVASGSIGFGAAKSHTIQASGSGRLVVGSQDVTFFASSGTGSDIMTVSAPLATSVAGPHHLIVPLLRTLSKLQLTGSDQIGAYSNLVIAGGGGFLELGGPSDRSFSGTITGWGVLRKSGAGTLRLAGSDLRPDGSGLTVAEGRLAVGSANAVRGYTWGDSGIVINGGASVEVESNVVWNARFTFNHGATLTGDGKVNTAKTIGTGSRVAPSKTVGKLTTAALTFTAGSRIDWELGNGVATAGTDYDLLRVEGNLVLPTGTVTLNIGDAGARTASVNGQSFTVAEWTGTDPASTPVWSYVNLSPETIDASGALLSIDTAANKLVLTGLKDVTPDATVILIL